METEFHTFSELFDQLGLPSDPKSIEQFIARHKPLADDVRLADAPFWNEAQREFLVDAIIDDSDWAEQVDQLNALLRA